MGSEVDLKACPFCGRGGKVVTGKKSTGLHFARIACVWCGAMTASSSAFNEAGLKSAVKIAARYWNKRVDDAKIEAKEFVESFKSSTKDEEDEED